MRGVQVALIITMQVVLVGVLAIALPSLPEMTGIDDFTRLLDTSTWPTAGHLTL